MAKYNGWGQWALDGDEKSLLWKTEEKKDSGKTELVDRKVVDPDSEEAKAIWAKLAKAILDGAPKQPTNEQMFGHLVQTEEQIQKAKTEWENRISDGYKAAVKPINVNHTEHEWGTGKSFREQLTEEELEKYEKEENDFDKRSR